MALANVHKTTRLSTRKTHKMNGRAASPRRTRMAIPADQTFSSLRRHMLIDGFDLVVDLKRSKGSYLVDARDGKRYLDFFTFVASNPLGMNHPKLTTPAFLRRLARIAVCKPSLSDIYVQAQAEFVETFARVAMPKYLPHCFFIEGGALGVENALKAAFDWKIRKNLANGYREERGRQIIHFRHAFHGRTGYTLSLTNTDPAKTDLFPKFHWPRVLNPSIRFPLNEENLARVIQDEDISVSQIKQAFYDNKDDIAGIIIEVIQGEGGDNHFRAEFLCKLRELADENEAMLIFDEVQTGIGLTGKMWAHQHFVEPDMIAFGKKVQVCGFLSSRRIEEVNENVFAVPSRLNSTWGGNLVDMVRAQKYLEVIQEENLVENARVVGRYLLQQLHGLAHEFPQVVSNARGRGLFCAFDLVTPEVRKDVQNRCFRKGLIILPSGERALRFRPPLNVTKREIDLGISVIRESMKDLKG